MKAKLYPIFLFCIAACSTILGQPKITSFSPLLGDVGVTITINGSNFNTTPASNIVRFGITSAAVLTASANQLTVSVPAGANYGAISVTNKTTGLSGNSASYFTPTFSPTKGRIHDTDFVIGIGIGMSNARTLACTVSDLNSDGKPDLMGLGGYSTATSYNLYSGTNNTAAGVTSFTKDSFSLGSTTLPTNMAAGDLDGDGKPDVAIVLNNLSSVTILRNTTTTAGGVIKFATKITIPLSTAPYAIALIDMDGDGKKDLVSTSKTGGFVSVLPNTSTVGNISFGTQKTFTTGPNPENLDCADLDGDGKWDIVTTNSTASSISVLLNSSTGTGNFSFANKIDYTTGKGVTGVSIADIDTDGKLDIISASDSVNVFSIFRNLSTIGNISFAARYDYSVGQDMIFTGISDFDGDGKIDIAVNATMLSASGFFSYGTKVIRNISTTGNFAFVSPVAFAMSSNKNSLAFAGDINLDGKPDFVNYGEGFIFWRKNKSELSGNANLASLSITGGTLSPTSPDYTQQPVFFVNIPYDSTVVHILANVVDTGYASLSVQVNGNGYYSISTNVLSQVSLIPGPNTIQVRVTAQNGTQKIYIINAVRVLRPQLLSFSPPSGTIGTLIYLKGKDLSVNPTVSIGGVKAVIVNYTDTTITVMAMPNTITSQIKVGTISGSSTHSDVFAVTTTTYPSILEGSKQSILSGTNIGLGYKVAVSADGNTGVYGANTVSNGIGAAAVSTRTGGVWSNLTFLPGTGNIGNSKQGSAVAISADGKTIISGGIGDNGNIGAAWIFINNNGVWKKQAKIVGTGYGNFDTPLMGCSVALSADGNTAAMGGRADNSNKGSVWIFVRTDSVWKQQQLIASTLSSANFGSAVSLSADGNTLLIGSEGDNTFVGAAYVYVRNGSTWTLQTKVTGTGAIGNSYQGASVSLSADGNTALVGGYFDSTARGACWMYKRTGTSWNQDGKKIVHDALSNKGQFGYSVSLSADGNIAAIGSLYTLTLTGSVSVYKRINGKMERQVNYLPSTGVVGFSNTYVGSAAAISSDGCSAVMGAPGDDGNNGAVWHYFAVQSTVCTLSSLTTNVGSLTPSFNAATLNYTLNAGTANTINFTPTATDTTATILVSVNSGTAALVKSGTASASLPLLVGTNTITISVIAQAGATYNYTIIVNKDCPKDSTTTSVNVCAAALPYLWNSNSYNNSGTYYKTLTSSRGCDSVVVLKLSVITINPSITSTNLRGCNSLVYNGNIYTATTNFIDTIKSKDGCDSVYNTLNITIINLTPQTFVNTLKGCNSLVYNSITYTVSTTLRDTIKSIYGCDSVINIVDLKVGFPTTSSSTIVANVSYTWNGITYTSSGTYTKTLIGANSNGCDSTATLNLSIIAKGCWYKVNGGATHVVAIKGDGTLWAWGANSFGQLGNGSTVSSKIPTQVGIATNWASVSAGNNFTLAIKTDGTLWAWGYNADGELGDGTTTNKSIPKQIGTANNWASVATGEGHTVALKTDGTLWAWGYNAYGQLGDGTITINNPTPTQIGTANNWASIAVKGNFTLATKKNNTLWAWGRNNNSQLGDGTTVNKSAPVQLGSDSNWTSIAAGYDHCVALKSDGTLWTWGLNNFKQLGDGSTITKSLPSKVGTQTNWASIVAGFNHSLAIKSDGTLWTWGYNLQGQLGNGTTVNGGTPTKIGTASNWLSLGAGNVYSLATQNDGSVWTWGSNLYYQLGDGTSIDKLIPTLIGICNNCTGLIPATASVNLSGCGSVVYNGITYTSNTTKLDTIKTVQGCDSLYKTANIIITNTPPTRDTSATVCGSLNWYGTVFTKDTIATHSISNNISSSLNEGFDLGTTPSNGWTFTQVSGTYTTTGNYGAASPSLKFGASNDQIITPTLTAAATLLSFWVKSQSASGSSLLIEGFNGNSWVNVNTITTFPTTGSTITYNSTSTPVLPNGLTKFRFTYTKSAGNISFDDLSLNYSSSGSCDSIITLHLTTQKPITTSINLSGCNSVVYNGVTYILPTIKRDTIRSINGCDSIYKLANININNITAINATKQYDSCNQNTFKGLTYFSSTIIKDTLKTLQGCDSIYTINYINVNPTISGRIYHLTKGNISNIKISQSGTFTNTFTASGSYAVPCITANNNVALKPTKNNDITKANGINATDVLFVQRHILNITKFNSAYKLIAADVNGDKNINATDVLRIKRLILGIDTTFTSATKGNRLWEFVDSSYQFPDTTNPFPFKDSISFTNLTSNKINQTFIGVKLGDVNYDWNPLVSRSVEVKPVELVAKAEWQVVSGEVKIPVTVNNFKELVAMQYTLHFNNKNYEFVGIENNKLDIDFNSNQDGNIGFLWTDKTATEKTLEDGTEVFVLVLKQKGIGDLELGISNDITEIAAWDKNYYQHNIILSQKLKIESQNLNEQWKVSPNPTNGEIRISLTSKISKVVKLELSNAEGKIFYTQNLETLKGNNIFYLNLKKKQHLPIGLYFLKVDNFIQRLIIN